MNTTTNTKSLLTGEIKRHPKAVGKQIAVLMDDHQTETVGGILLPLPKLPDTGIAVSVGKEVEFVAVGDRVQILPQLGTRFEIRGDNYIFATEKQLAGILSE